jgi:hypothetical protein
MTLSEVTPLVATGAGIWAVVNAVMTSVAAINERRDTVITGCLGGKALTKEHRRLIMKSDWLAMTSGVVLLLIGVGLLIGFLPELIGGLRSALVIILRTVGIGFIVAAVMSAVNCVDEHKAMAAAIDLNPAPVCKDGTETTVTAATLLPPK